MTAERRRLKVSAGAFPSPKIASLAACHPFSKQLDVVFPSNVDLLSRLEQINSSYSTGRAGLAELLASATGFVNSVVEESSILAVGVNTHGEDAWCIDPRGHLTLSVVKETYERLGLVGQKAPFKGHEGRHIIDIPLRRNGLSPSMQVRVKSCLEGWDQRRTLAGLGQEGTWDVVFCTRDRGQTSANPFRSTKTHSVSPVKRELRDVFVPCPDLCDRPSRPLKGQSQNKPDVDQDALAEAADDWDRRIENLFEWVGMACLGAQRLNANDRVDPYVALYEPPLPGQIQNITHLSWRGLLPPSFVNEVLDVVQNCLGDPNSPSFVSVTAHALSESPVSYMPYTLISSTKNVAAALEVPKKVPAKVPRADGEDTWCAIFGSRTGSDGVRWCLGESLGQLDARWG